MSEIRPAMLDSEFLLFKKHYLSANQIIEYGAGGSTYFAVTNTNASIVSVEADLDWIESLRKEAPIAKAEDEGRLQIIHFDIGPVGRWSYPKDESKIHRWSGYPSSPWRTRNGVLGFLLGRNRQPDLVFVDGRFRLAAILTSILNSAPGIKIMVHDFWNREYYHPALAFLDEIESVETLAIFRRRGKIDTAYAKSLLAACRLDYR
jgi:hypothetical protein